MRACLAERGLDGQVEVDSAGTLGYHAGERADARMREAASGRGYDLQSRSRQVAPEDFEAFDLVIAMDRSNLEDLRGDGARTASSASSACSRSSYRKAPPETFPTPTGAAPRGFETSSTCWKRPARSSWTSWWATADRREPSPRVTPTLHRAVEKVVAEATGREVRVAGDRPVGGGCIHDARLLDLDDGGALFVKSNRDAPPEMFEREAEGLRALAAPDVIRVPSGPIAGASDDGTRFLVMEAIETGRPKRGFFEDFGRRFARLHRETVQDRDRPFGFDHDNYLGSTPQPNGRMASWVDFFRERRLGHQLRLARKRGLGGPDLDRLGDRLLDRLDEWIDLALLPGEPACLLHGDLWSGNYLADESGEPVLVDPAAYHGHREADLAMTQLFGGFDRAFYTAYEEEWPLPPGSPERLEIYQLYHLLNHLNLFGGGYRSQCLAILRRLVG